MAKIFFSSWNNQIIDERNKLPEERADLKNFDLPPGLEKDKVKALIGWAGIIVMEPEVNLVELLREYYRAMQDQSCGRCIPCRAGSRVLADRLGKFCEGEGKPEDLDYLREMATLIRNGSLCELGISSPLPLLHGLDYFEDQFRKAASGERIESTEHDYRSILTAPCRNGCPAHINIPGYIEAISEGDYEKALLINREKTPFVGTLGRVCVHPCESNCNRQPVDQALSIRLLKRFAADFGLRNGFDEKQRMSPPDRQKERIAVVGAGPAGINAAYQLAGRGYNVTIFEALPIPGGMLAVGIPSYRLPREMK